MIKFTTHHPDGKLVIGLGLSHVNLKRLKEGQPIVFDLKELGLTLNAEVFVFAGKTEASMQKDLGQYIGPETVVNKL